MAKRKRHLKIYKKDKKRKGVLLLFKFLVGGFFSLALFVLLLFIYYAKDLPRPEKFLERDVFQATKIYDRTGEILLYSIYGEEKREVISLDQMPDHLKKAVIATEDEHFYQHHGIEPRGIARSFLVNLKLKQPAQGGSTITQQLIRSTFLTLEKTAERKVREIILTLELERRYSKDKILEWYLNQVPFGSNAYGVEAASQTFFKKKADDISLSEAAVLASLIQAPSYLSPYGTHQEELLKRKDYVLDRMTKSGFISKEDAEKAKQEAIQFAEILAPIKAPHFVLHVKEILEREYGEEFLSQKGLKIYTSLSWELQKAAEEIVINRVEINKNYGAFNAALVASDPNTGEILAMVGSADWFGDPYPENCISGKDCKFDPKFNIAVGTKNSLGRQPGSAFKPFAYAVAFGKGYPAETVLWDTKTEFSLNCKSDASQVKDKYGLDCYHPGNYNGKFQGPLTMRSSLAQSINVTSVKTLYLAGVEETIDLAQKLGITTIEKDASRYGLSLVLGGGEVKLLEMVSAYGVFASEGLSIPPVSILRIEDSNGKIIKENKKVPKKVLETETCRMINDVLSDNEARLPVFRPNSSLHFEAWQVAAKTGTTQEYKDAWTIGYTPSIVTGVWAGNNDNSPTANQPGLVLAAPIFHEFMEKALPTYPKQEFKKPSPVETEKIILNGEVPEDQHSILHYVNKEDPRGPEPTNPEEDSQYEHWENGIKNWLLSNTF